MINENEQEIHRGEIYYIEFGYMQEGGGYKTRPVIIVSNDENNEHAPIVTVVPCTSKDKKPLPTHVELPTGLGVYGRVLCEQVQTVSKAKLHQYVGEADDATMRKIEEAICVQCGIERKVVSVPTVTVAPNSVYKPSQRETMPPVPSRGSSAYRPDQPSKTEAQLRKELAQMTERAKIFEQLYKEQIAERMSGAR